MPMTGMRELTFPFRSIHHTPSYGDELGLTEIDPCQSDCGNRQQNQHACGEANLKFHSCHNEFAGRETPICFEDRSVPTPQMN